jgi:acyl-CoA thioesterase I
MNLKKYGVPSSFLLIVIFNVCLTVCVAQPKLPLLAGNAVIVAFGDSVTYGSGAQPSESYPAVLEKMLGRRVVNAGVYGEITTQGLSRLPSILDKENPTILLLCLGINDQLLNINPQTAADNIREMIRIAQKRGVTVVLIAVPDLKLSPSCPPPYREIAREFDIILEEKALSTILAANSSLKVDKLHPNAAGYQLIAKSIASIIQNKWGEK